MVMHRETTWWQLEAQPAKWPAQPPRRSAVMWARVKRELIVLLWTSTIRDTQSTTVETIALRMISRLMVLIPQPVAWEVRIQLPYNVIEINFTIFGEIITQLLVVTHHIIFRRHNVNNQRDRIWTWSDSDCRFIRVWTHLYQLQHHNLHNSSKGNQNTKIPQLSHWSSNLITVLCTIYLTGNNLESYFQVSDTSAVVTVEEGIHSSNSPTNFEYQTARTAEITAISRNMSSVEGTTFSHSNFSERRQCVLLKSKIETVWNWNEDTYPCRRGDLADRW